MCEKFIVFKWDATSLCLTNVLLIFGINNLIVTNINRIRREKSKESKNQLFK